MLQSIEKTTTKDYLFRHMSELVAKDGELNDLNLAHLHYGLYKSHERSRSFENAFENLLLANEYQASARMAISRREYHLSEDIALIEKIKKLHAFGGLPDPSGSIAEIFKPVFIVGMPRSGTSLVEKIIGNHRNVQGLGELTYLERAIERHLGLDKKNLPDDVSKVRNDYYEKIRHHSINTLFFIDKMPFNFRWIGVITKAFPESKIVHVHRQPQATCFSVFANLFAGYVGFDNRLNDICGYFKAYSSMMEFWSNTYSDRIFHLDYEFLVEDPEMASCELFRYLGLEWDKNLIKSEQNSSFTKTASRLQVRRPIYKNSSAAWKEYKSFWEEFSLVRGPKFECLKLLTPKDT